MTRDVSRRGAMWGDVREFSGGVRVTWYEVMTGGQKNRLRLFSSPLKSSNWTTTMKKSRLTMKMTKKMTMTNDDEEYEDDEERK